MTVGAASGAKGTGATKGGGGGAAGTTTEVDGRILWFSEKCRNWWFFQGGSSLNLSIEYL